MIEENICERGTTLVRRLTLEPGEATPWHVDPYHRVNIVVRGEALLIEFRGGGDTELIEVRPGLAEWDEPTDRIHRAVNVGRGTYEQVSVLFVDRPGATPQPTRE